MLARPIVDFRLLTLVRSAVTCLGGISRHHAPPQREPQWVRGTCFAWPEPEVPRDQVTAVASRDGTSEQTVDQVFTAPRAGLLRREVTLAIEQAILLGAVAPSQRLVEADVASQMGISK